MGSPLDRLPFGELYIAISPERCREYERRIRARWQDATDPGWRERARRSPREVTP